MLSIDISHVFVGKSWGFYAHETCHLNHDLWYLKAWGWLLLFKDLPCVWNVKAKNVQAGFVNFITKVLEYNFYQWHGHRNHDSHQWMSNLGLRLQIQCWQKLLCRNIAHITPLCKNHDFGENSFAKLTLLWALS